MPFEMLFDIWNVLCALAAAGILHYAVLPNTDLTQPAPTNTKWMGFDSALALALEAAYLPGGQRASRCGSLEVYNQIDMAHVSFVRASYVMYVYSE